MLSKPAVYGLVTTVILGLLILGGFFILQDKNPLRSVQSTQEPPTIKVGDVFINVELAVTPHEHAQGLSGRTSLPENQGMLFMFDKPGQYSFWMKDMNFPIDIIWIDENYRIADITKNLSPDTFPQSFQPSKPAQYVLEVTAGFADRNNINIGDAVDFSEAFPAQKIKNFHH